QILGGFPDFGKHLNAGLTVGSRTRGHSSASSGIGQGTAQKPDSVLAIVTADPAELFQHRRLLCAPPTAVALIDGSQILPLTLSRHTKFLHHLPSFSCHHASKEG